MSLGGVRPSGLSSSDSSLSSSLSSTVAAIMSIFTGGHGRGGEGEHTIYLVIPHPNNNEVER